MVTDDIPNVMSPADWASPQPHNAQSPRRTSGAHKLRLAAAAAVEGWELSGRDPTGDKTWRQDAACVNVDTDLFYPEAGVSAAEAVTVCVQCGCAKQCLAAGLLGNELGVWGATSWKARKKILAVMRSHVRECPEDRTVAEFVEVYETLWPHGGSRSAEGDYLAELDEIEMCRQVQTGR